MLEYLKNDPEIFYLIDFGLCEIFKEKNVNHIKKKYTSQFKGNVQFASLNSC